jgi:hypothetical protein
MNLRDKGFVDIAVAAVAVKIRAFFAVTPCSLETAPCFGGTSHIPLQDRRVG